MKESKRARRTKRDSAVVIRDECIVDIDLPCRTEPARSFLQHSFITLASLQTHTCTRAHIHPHTHTQTHTPQRSPAGTEALPERALLLSWLLGYGSMMLQPADSLLNDVVYFLQTIFYLGMGTCHSDVTWGTMRGSQLDCDMIVKVQISSTQRIPCSIL